MKTTRLKYMIVGLLCCTSVVAQTKKLDKTFKTNKEVTVKIDATHTDVFVEYWDKNEVQVEAVLDGNGTGKTTVQKALDNWKVDTKATAGEVTINSSGDAIPGGGFDMARLEEPLSKLPEMLAPLQEMMVPMMESFASNPLPPEFYANMGDLKFDYEAYEKEGDKYLEKFEKKVEKSFGKDFEKSMEKWAAKIEKDSALWNSHARKMEEMGEKFGKSMEAWGEQFGKDMEAWGEQFGKNMEAMAEQMERNQMKHEENAKKMGETAKKQFELAEKLGLPKKEIRVKMPRNGNLQLKVRHGDVNLPGTSKNLKGDLTHSKFTAGTLLGEGTNLRVAYTPVKVKNWQYGVLGASYVQDLKLDRVESIKLTSNSSDVVIQELVKDGIFKGTFGELSINKVDPRFNSLDIVLENSDLVLDLPEAAYNLDYNGTRSEVKYPQGLNLKSSKSYDTQKLSGYNKEKNAASTVSINASFSDVLLK